MNGYRILLVDDDASILRLLSMRLESVGYDVLTAESGERALKILETKLVDVMMTDLKMEGMNGLELFSAVQQRHPGLPVIMLTAHGTIPDAVSATREGIFGYLTKPVDKAELLKVIDEAIKQTYRANAEGWSADIVTRSERMQTLLNQASRVAAVDVSILLSGPSGSGKEVLAKAIHKASSRADKPFVAINCGALPEHLLESELFGHAKGAFTGAVNAHQGLFLAADGGTLFLDEIGDMPQPLQVKLLRVIQERQVRPLGSTKSIPIDVRILSATHRDLKKAMEGGHFREDLYYRLNVVNLNIPSLAERVEDIPLLAQHLLTQIATRSERAVRGFSKEAINKLIAAPWPGNVRQLVNVVEQCVALAGAPIISASLVEQALACEESNLPTLAEARSSFERRYLDRVLKLADGKVSMAAQLAGRNRTEFYKLLNKHDLSSSDYRNSQRR